MKQKAIRIGTRKSDLALSQASLVAQAIVKLDSTVTIEQIQITSSGDKKRNMPEGHARDKKDWVIEFEEALIAGTIDIAVHSAKDIPVDIHPDTAIACVLPRATPNDCLILGDHYAIPDRKALLETLPLGATVGTTSKRRVAQLLKHRPDLRCQTLRGNVPTRFRRVVMDRDFDAAVLATAGLERLGMLGRNTFLFSIDEMIPAVNQGILAVQYRKDSSLESLLCELSDRETAISFALEREVVQNLEADCNSALGVYACAKQDAVSVVVRVLSENGEQCIEAKQSGEVSSLKQVADTVVESLLALGAKDLL